MFKATIFIAAIVVAAALPVEGKNHDGHHGHHGHHHGHHHAPSDAGSADFPFDGSDDKGKPWSGSGFGGRFPDVGNSNEMPPFQAQGSFHDDHHGNEDPNNEQQPPSLGRYLKGEEATEGDKDYGLRSPRFHGSNGQDSWHGSGSFDGHFPHQPNAGSNEKPRGPRGERGSKPPKNTDNSASNSDNEPFTVSDVTINFNVDMPMTTTTSLIERRIFRFSSFTDLRAIKGFNYQANLTAEGRVFVSLAF
ncbi:Hypothetical protein PHPALM_508 [Phytophthora palmivora]|uniref:Uncharacterized protein n=1 Tax=Phytophthora palmivora TaxID=4796 RepID=A0A2P4YUN0_9STRA|nr:Hypothetical protein PHPALM_508 [Phytophthora palmivora]